MSEEEKVTIEGLNQRGFGISTDIAVPFTLPNEVVTVVCQRGRYKKQRFGALQNIHVKNVERTSPRCKHFTHCSGCSLQHFSLEGQCSFKEQRILHLFQPYVDTSTTIFPILTSAPWCYRNKMEYTFSEDTKQNRFLGLFEMGRKKRVFCIEECFLVEPWFTDTVKAVYEWWQKSTIEAYYPPRDIGTLRSLTVRGSERTLDRCVILTVSGNPQYALKKSDMEAFCHAVEKVIAPKNPGELIIVIRIQQAIKGKPTQFFEMTLRGPYSFRERLSIDVQGVKKEMEFWISPSSFFQSNTAQAERVYSRALALAQIEKNDIVYDLYCGTAVFGMCASLIARKVIGIDLCRDAVYDAQENAKRLGLPSFLALCGDVAKVLEVNKQELPSIVLVDPPRAGLSKKAIEQIGMLKAKKIVYISCNPITQVQDIALFIEKGYRITGIQPVDQFPQTAHIENIVVLER